MTMVAKVNPQRIIRNAVRCNTCGDEIESTDRHDFKWCSCGAVAVDGGLDYLRRAWTVEQGTGYTELSEWASE